MTVVVVITRMRANAQRDGRPVEYRWLTCSNAAKKRNPLKFAGVPHTPEPISAVSGPKFTTRTCGRHIGA